MTLSGSRFPESHSTFLAPRCFKWVVTNRLDYRTWAGRPALIEDYAVLAAVKDASRRSAVVFGHP